MPYALCTLAYIIPGLLPPGADPDRVGQWITGAPPSCFGAKGTRCSWPHHETFASMAPHFSHCSAPSTQAPDGRPWRVCDRNAVISSSV
jgi:hypothetical protein